MKYLSKCVANICKKSAELENGGGLKYYLGSFLSLGVTASAATIYRIRYEEKWKHLVKGRKYSQGGEEWEAVLHHYLKKLSDWGVR